MSRFWVALVAALLGACSADVTRELALVRVVPRANPACGAAADGRTLVITALGEFAAADRFAQTVPLEAEAVTLERFPAQSRQLAVEVVGGRDRVIGKTATFAFDELEAGAELPVLMAPSLGFCEVGPMHQARSRPLVARAGAGVLVAGGRDAEGPALGAELYDPRTAAFRVLPTSLYGTGPLGLLGASMTTLGDGRVVVAGGERSAYQVFDPALAEFGRAGFLAEPRAHHAALPWGQDELLLIGGCSELGADGSCIAGAYASSVFLNPDSGGLRPGPALRRPRIGATAVLEPTGAVLVIGGYTLAGEPLRTAERLAPAGAATEMLELDGAAAVLEGAGTLVVGTRAAFLPAGGATASALSLASERSGASVTALEDGQALLIGGSDQPALLYQPLEARFLALETPPPPLSEHAAVRLGDGTVLIVGGNENGSPTTRAWSFRPALTGPFASEAVAAFNDLALAKAVVPRDPAAVRVEEERLVLRSSGRGGALPWEWVLLAGPRFADAVITVRGLTARGGGVAVLLAVVDATNYAALVLLPGQPATLFVLRDGRAIAADCTGAVLPAAALETVELTVERRGARVRGYVDGDEILTCTNVALAPGMVGLGVVGPSGAEVAVDFVGATR